MAASLVRLARTKSNLTQAELASRAGTTQSVIAAYENGRRQPTIPTLVRLLSAAGLELRARLAEPDTTSATVGAWESSRPPSERRRWREEQMQFAKDA